MGILISEINTETSCLDFMPWNLLQLHTKRILASVAWRVNEKITYCGGCNPRKLPQHRHQYQPHEQRRPITKIFIISLITLYTSIPTIPEVACRRMGHAALHYTSEYVGKDMRVMAVELLPSMKSKGMIIDEVVIHLRCRDIINKNMPPKDKNYRLLQFQVDRKRIPPLIKSIGIVTAPFSAWPSSV